MEKNQIVNELKNWESNEYKRKIEDNLSLYVKSIDRFFFEYYLSKIKDCSKEYYDEIITTLIDKKIIDEDLNLTNGDNVSVIESKKINGGFDGEKIIISSMGARLFYNSYMLFSDGNLDGIRAFDYSLPLNQLQGLTQLEMLYWCFINNITYEEFCKTTIVHENTHRWIMDMTSFDDTIAEIITEGIVESDSREIATKYNLNYIPIFREKEIEVASKFVESIPTNDLQIYKLIYNGNERIIVNYLFNATDGDPNCFENYDVLMRLFADAYLERKTKKEYLSKTNGWTSLHEVFSTLDLFDQRALIDKLEQFRLSLQEKHMQ